MVTALTFQTLGGDQRELSDIPSLWTAADTPAADREELVRALIERVTATMPGDAENVLVGIQWIGGTSTNWRYSLGLSLS